MTLRELREKKQLSQVQVAARGGLEQTSVSQLELGKISDPRLSTLTGLARAYRVSLRAVVKAHAQSLGTREAA